MANQEQNKYSLALKQQVIQEYECGASLAALQRQYGIPPGPTIRRWLKQFSSHPGGQSPMTEQAISPTLEVQALQKRIAVLEKVVAQLSLDKLMQASTITVLEQRGEAVKKRPARHHQPGGRAAGRTTPSGDRRSHLRLAGVEPAGLVSAALPAVTAG